MSGVLMVIFSLSGSHFSKQMTIQQHSHGAMTNTACALLKPPQLFYPYWFCFSPEAERLIVQILNR